MRSENLKIHSENILPLIKKWLYSDKDIFVRELVSNASDAILKLKKITASDEEGKIEIFINKEKRTLTFSDNGIGMDTEEVEKYIAQIAFSGASEFLKKYQTNKEEDQIIGHFGLGFYSAYMVAEVVEIQTCSYKEGSEGVFWSSRGDATYTIGKGNRQKRGTDIILTLPPDESEYLEHSRLKEILVKYCRFLPFSIYLNGSKINDKTPLWIKQPLECSEKEYLDFFRTLFPTSEDPLFWIHLNIDYPFHLKGILYFPKISQNREFKKETLQLYCNRVFVSESCKDFLPDYLTILQGAIDSPDIPLNVSRSTLQLDGAVRQLGAHISKKISDRLSALYRSEKDKFIACWEDLEPIVKFGVLQDDKFYQKAKEFLIWKNSKNEWCSLLELVERSKEKTLYYMHEEDTFFELFREKGIEVLFIKSSFLEQAVMQFLERELGLKFKRIDSCLDDQILDSSREKNLLDQEGKSESARLADFFRKKLALEHVEVEAKSLSSNTIAGFLMIKEEERRLRDSLVFRGIELKKSGSFVKPTFVINTNSPLILAIYATEKRDPELAKQMATQVYDLASLSQKEMEPKMVSQFVARTTHILEKLAVELAAANKL